MGGGTSRFEETDWDTADGKLTSREETVDNAPPTGSYGVYYLVKRGVNQRDYHVTDENSNVLYTTRAVEGTLAWFDVLGKGMDEYLLRVQVDLSRRYWVVYRYGVPAFADQACDVASTLKLSSREGPPQKPLFRKACITVSWARYHAIVDMYEPAPENNHVDHDVEKDGNKNSLLEEKKCDDITQPADPPVEDGKDESRDTSEAAVEAAQSQCLAEESKSELAHVLERDPGSTTIPSEDVASLQSDAAAGGEVDETIKGRVSARRRTSQLEVWSSLVKSKVAETIDAASRPYTPANREEGVITLDRPVLKVQEINSFTGQHQTMLIRKDEVQKLKNEELQMEAELAAQTQALSTSPGSVELPQPESLPLDATHIQQPAAESTNDATTASMVDSLKANDSENAEAPAKGKSSDTPDDFKSDTSASVESSSDANQEAETITGDEGEENAKAKDEENVKPEDVASSTESPLEPLVGFWAWDNTLRVHKMKMHVGKGADLALHVILAVVTNQLRTERHAIAVSV